MDPILVFKALSDGTRFRIVETLLDGEKCVCLITKAAKVGQSTTSIHLSKMEAQGILQSRKCGKMVIYRIKEEKVCEVMKLFREVNDDWTNKTILCNQEVRI